MKKNVMMRTASLLLVLVLMTSSVISGTFAKYVTDGTATDNARVAKFGVVVNGSTDIFDATYDKTDSGYAGDVTVSADTNAVAPGTGKTMGAFTITGQPEVATRVTFSANVDLANWEVDGGYYCPLIVKVTDNTKDPSETTTIKGLDYSSMDAFENAIEAAVVAITKDYAPGANMADIVDDISVSWEWPIENPADAALKGTLQWQSNAKDTKLGDAAVTNAATISIAITCTVTQID